MAGHEADPRVHISSWTVIYKGKTACRCAPAWFKKIWLFFGARHFWRTPFLAFVTEWTREWVQTQVVFDWHLPDYFVAPIRAEQITPLSFLKSKDNSLTPVWVRGAFKLLIKTSRENTFKTLSIDCFLAWSSLAEGHTQISPEWKINNAVKKIFYQPGCMNEALVYQKNMIISRQQYRVCLQPLPRFHHNPSYTGTQ